MKIVQQKIQSWWVLRSRTSNCSSVFVRTCWMFAFAYTQITITPFSILLFPFQLFAYPVGVTIVTHRHSDLDLENKFSWQTDGIDGKSYKGWITELCFNESLSLCLGKYHHHLGVLCLFLKLWLLRLGWFFELGSWNFI